MWNAGGRIGRDAFLRANGFFAWVIAAVVIALVVTTAMTKLGSAILTAGLLLAILGGLGLAGRCHLELVVRRLHDLGVTGWLSLPLAIGWLWIVAAAFAALADTLIPGSALGPWVPAPQTWLRGRFTTPHAGDLAIFAVAGYYAVLMGALLMLDGSPAANRYGAPRPKPEPVS